MDPDKTSTSASIGGTMGYWAFEALMGLRIRRESDIFSLGIVFYEVLSGGKHPFGNDHLDQNYNIKHKQKTTLPDITDDGMKNLLSLMLLHESNLRPSATDTKSHLSKLFEKIVTSSNQPFLLSDALLDKPFPKDKEEYWTTCNWLALYGHDIIETVTKDISSASHEAGQQVKTIPTMKKRQDEANVIGSLPKKEIKITKAEDKFHRIERLNSEFKEYAAQGHGPQTGTFQIDLNQPTKVIGFVENELLNGSTEKAVETAEEFFEAWPGTQPLPHASVVYEHAETCLRRSHQEIRAVLLFVTASVLYKVELPAMKACDGIYNCINKISSAVHKILASEGGDVHFQDVTKRFVLPNMMMMLGKLKETKTQQTNKLKQLEALSLECIAACCFDAQNYESAIDRANTAKKIFLDLPLPRVEKTKFLNSAQAIVNKSQRQRLPQNS